jgi:hypothetical protein
MLDLDALASDRYDGRVASGAANYLMPGQPKVIAMKYQTILSSIVFTNLLVVSSSVVADELSILDCGGRVRAVTESQIGSTHNVTIGIVAPNGSRELSPELLVNVEEAASAAKASCTVVNGAAQCSGMAVGAWKVCFNVASYDLGEVTIREQVAGGARSSVQTAALVTGSVGGVAALVALGGSSSTGDNSPELAASDPVILEPVDAGGSKVPTSSDFCTPGVISARTGRVGTRETCLNDADPVELSPFE